MTDQSVYDEIARFDNGYRPEAAFAPGLDTLPDGDYDFAVQGAHLDRTKNTNDLILRVALKVAQGSIVEKSYFFKTQTGVNQLGADLCALGLECHGKRPFSEELKTAILRLPGIHFRAKKTTDKNGYPNLYIAGRTTGATVTPTPPPAKPLATPPPATEARGRTTASPLFEAEIPF